MERHDELVTRINTFLQELQEILALELLLRYEWSEGTMREVFSAGDGAADSLPIAGEDLEILPGGSPDDKAGLSDGDAPFGPPGVTATVGQRSVRRSPIVTEGELRGWILAVNGRAGAFDRRSEALIDLAARGVADALYATPDNLGNLIRKLTSAEERERERIAEVFHGDLQQLLAGAKVHADAALRKAGDHGFLSERLTTASTLLGTAIERTRRLSHQLSSPLLRRVGLLPALRRLVGEVKRNLNLTVDLTESGELPRLPTDCAVILYRAVQELLLNISKHAGVDTATVEIAAEEGSLRISVRDDGHGFDIDESLSASRSLGILTLRERLSALGGSIHLEASPGEGSNVHVLIPAAAIKRLQGELDTRGEGSPSPAISGVLSPAPPPAESPEAEDGSAPALSILLVDDHAVIRQGLSSILSEEPDLTVVGEARNGEEALSRVRELRPALVVLDFAMPDFNGDEVARLIKGEFPETRIIGLSMHDEADTRRRMIAAGAEAHLPKEAPPGELIALIRSAPDSTNML